MIKRDGYRNSLWQDNIQPYNKQNMSKNATDYDVIIVGGGITGVSTALLLQEAGKNCLLLDSQNLCFGTTGGTTAHLNTLLDTPYYTIAKNFSEDDAKLVAGAASAAINLIKDNINRFKIDCGFEETSAWLFAQNDDQDKELEKISETSKEAGLSLDYSNRLPVNIPFTRALKVEGQAKFSPLEYVYALATAFENAGGRIIEHCKVISAEETERITVKAALGTFTADYLIYATHVPPGINFLHLRLTPYRSYAMAVKLKDGKYPEGLCYDMYDPYHYYRSQVVNGKEYLIVGGYDHKTGHEENTQRCFVQLESHIRKHFNVESVLYSWSSQYYESADGLPYIGHLPGHPGHILVATGYGGNGMTYSNVAALVLRNIILETETPLEKLFDPNRLKPFAGFTSVLSQNADVLKEFVSSRLLSHEKLETLATLAPGEGKVVNYEGEKVALHKDYEGNLHALNPVCTHMKCEVKWNIAEQSWDCPCHGGRFNADGEVLNCPVDRNLEIVLGELIEKED